MGDPSSDRPAGRSPASWAMVVVFIVAAVVLNVWYDYHHPLGIIFDVILALALAVRYMGKSE